MAITDMKIRKRLALGFAIVLALTTSMTVLAVYNTRDIQKRMERFLAVNYTRTQIANNVTAQVRDVIILVRDLLLEKRVDEKKAILQKIKDGRAKYGEEFKKLEEMMNKEDAEGIAALEKIKESLAVVRPLNTKVVELAMAGKTEAGISYLNSEAGPAVRKWMETVDAYVAHENKRAAIRLDESVKLYNNALIAQSILTGVVFVLAFLVVRFLSQSITRPLDDTVTVAIALSKGKLNANITDAGKDEIGQLRSAMRAMIEELRLVVIDISKAVETVSNGSRNLSGSSTDLDKGAKELSLQVEQVVTSMTEVSQTIMDMAKNASQAADASKTASATASDGKEIVDRTVNDMAKIAKIVQEAAATIEELGKSSAQIGEIVTVINGIADQTNLLALNAAIEAARAGEQGRGFAVVADEVRKLAERTTQATQDIAQRITSIQSAAGESVDAMKRGSDEVDKGVELARQASASLDSIVTASANAMDMVQRIAAATEQQSAATEEVTQTMENIATISKHSSESSGQIKQSAEELAGLSSKLNELISFFRGTSGEAETLVKKAVEFIKANGKEKAYEEFSRPKGMFTTRDLYVDVYDLNGRCLAHGQKPEMINKDLIDLQSADNKYFVRERVALAKSEGKGWQEYHFMNPITKTIEPKAAYIERYDDIIVGSGIYK